MNLVSIVTPTFNSIKFIDKCVASVLHQTYQNWELIIVDDYSADGTQEYLHQLSEQDERIKVYTLPQNRGASIARNKALEVSVGRYIAFLDSDDTWEPTKLDNQISFMQKHGHSFTYSDYNIINEADQIVGIMNSPARLSYEDILTGCSIGCLTVVIDRSKYPDIHFPSVRRGQDWAMWLSILKKGDLAHKVPAILSNYRLTRNSLSSNKLKKFFNIWYIYNKIEGYSAFKSTYLIFKYVHYYLVKRKKHIKKIDKNYHLKLITTR
jgi:teichuronic acid biosynthesis glycosyltransferase TuaG